MAFSKSKVTRFNEVPGCAPGVGSYDIKEIRKVQGAAAAAMTDKSQRFREMKDSTSSLEDSVMSRSSSMGELRTPNKPNMSMVKGIDRRRNAASVSTPRHQAENGKIKQLEGKIKHLLLQETEMNRRLQQAQEKTDKLNGKLQAAYKEKGQLQAQLAKSEKQIVELSRAKGGLMNKTGLPVLSREKRETQAECTLSYQYWHTEKELCNSCLCGAGKQMMAIFCGYGILKGEPTCEPCPTNTTRSGTDVTFNCRPCLKCDPDATVEAVCTQTEDTRCVCNDGMGFIGNACVSCRKHPNASGCHAERGGTTVAPETIEEDPTNPAEEPVYHGKQDHPGWWLIGFLVFIIIILLCVIIYYVKKHGGPCSRQSRGDRRNREEDDQSPDRCDVRGTPLPQKVSSNSYQTKVEKHRGPGSDHPIS